MIQKSDRSDVNFKYKTVFYHPSIIISFRSIGMAIYELNEIIHTVQDRQSAFAFTFIHSGLPVAGEQKSPGARSEGRKNWDNQNNLVIIMLIHYDNLVNSQQTTSPPPPPQRKKNIYKMCFFTYNL